MKARLFVLGGRDVGRSFEVELSCVLGRGEECEVRLSDRSVSRAHARLSYQSGVWVLEDLGSRNGVRVRGARVARAELADLDEFLLGELELRFRLEEAEPAAEAPAAPAAPPAPQTAALPEVIALPDEIVLEADDEVEPVRPAASAAPAERLARAARGSLFTWDLAELPGWKRALLVLLAHALAAGLAWLAFRGALRLRDLL